MYEECPKCVQAPVTLHDKAYKCENCGLVLKERSILGLFHKGRFGVERLSQTGNYSLAESSVANIRLAPDPLKVVLGNVYSDDQLAEIAQGNLDIIRPVRTVLAQIILEQLREECFVNVNGLRRGFGPPLPEESSYLPKEKMPVSGIRWQDEGNLFCTSQRLVLPSNQFTFIRLGRKVSAVQAFTNGFAVQLKNEDHATYFAGCYPHEAALVAAYVMCKIPSLRPVIASG
jgi:hypothetical protein